MRVEIEERERNYMTMVSNTMKQLIHSFLSYSICL